MSDCAGIERFTSNKGLHHVHCNGCADANERGAAIEALRSRLAAAELRSNREWQRAKNHELVGRIHGLEGTVRVNEHTIRSVSTQRDEARALALTEGEARGRAEALLELLQDVREGEVNRVLAAEADAAALREQLAELRGQLALTEEMGDQVIADLRTRLATAGALALTEGEARGRAEALLRRLVGPDDCDHADQGKPCVYHEARVYLAHPAIPEGTPTDE